MRQLQVADAQVAGHRVDQVIGIVTVVLVASVLANVRNQVALLFRDLGTENVFAFHLTGDPYVTPSEREARRRPLRVEFASEMVERIKTM